MQRGASGPAVIAPVLVQIPRIRHNAGCTACQCMASALRQGLDFGWNFYGMLVHKFTENEGSVSLELPPVGWGLARRVVGPGRGDTASQGVHIRHTLVS